MRRRILHTLLVAMLLAMLLPVCTALGEYKMPVEDGDLSVTEGLDENVRNILLIGIDTRERKSFSGRSDVMMICSLNQSDHVVNIISLARDTWVTIGDNGHQNKLNAAYSFGGPNLLMQTINRTYHLNIEEYVVVNFFGVCDIVDAMGGVTIRLDEDEAWIINSTTDDTYGNGRTSRVPGSADEVKLSGAQALGFMRNRYADNDFGRQSRQRKLLMAMARQVMDCSVPEMISLATTCLDYVKTNLSLFEIINLVTQVMGSGMPDIRMHAFPGEGEYRYDKGSSVSKVLVDTEYGAKKIHGILYPDNAQ